MWSPEQIIKPVENELIHRPRASSPSHFIPSGNGMSPPSPTPKETLTPSKGSISKSVAKFSRFYCFPPLHTDSRPPSPQPSWPPTWTTAAISRSPGSHQALLNPCFASIQILSSNWITLAAQKSFSNSPVSIKGNSKPQPDTNKHHKFDLLLFTLLLSHSPATGLFTTACECPLRLSSRLYQLTRFPPPRMPLAFSPHFSFPPGASQIRGCASPEPSHPGQGTSDSSEPFTRYACYFPKISQVLLRVRVYVHFLQPQ